MRSTSTSTPNPTDAAPASAKTSVLRKLSAATLGIGIGMVALAVPAGAQESSESVEIPPRVERACLRIPNLEIRTENLIERISGDADTLGSLEWLDRRIARAEENGRTELAEVLTNRRAVREATIPVLELRLERLDELATRCADLGVGQ